MCARSVAVVGDTFVSGNGVSEVGVPSCWLALLPPSLPPRYNLNHEQLLKEKLHKKQIADTVRTT